MFWWHLWTPPGGGPRTRSWRDNCCRPRSAKIMTLLGICLSVVQTDCHINRCFFSICTGWHSTLIPIFCWYQIESWEGLWAVWAVGRYSSGPPAGGIFVLMSTDYRNQGAVSPCIWIFIQAGTPKTCLLISDWRRFGGSLIRSAFCPKKVDLTSGLTLYPGYCPV